MQWPKRHEEKLLAPAGFQQVLNDAINAFVVDKNADTLVQALAQAAKEAAMNK